MRSLLRNAVVAAALAAIFLVAACHKTSDLSGLTVQSSIAPSPPHVGPVNITFALSDSSAKPVTGASVDLEADMSHAGMAAVFAKSTETAPGQYNAAMTFPMAGDWFILLHVALSNGTKVERQIEIKDVRAN